MNFRTLFISLSLTLFSTFNLAYSEKDAYIEMFSPQGTVKGVRQVTARFSEQMLPFGEPRFVEPFVINCPEKGQARWIDGKTWSYDFDKDLPAGIRCDFTLKEGLKTLSRNVIKGQKKYSFSTGGPAVTESYPWEGSESIDEDQIFVLTLDAKTNENSILSNVFFSIQGINERVGVRIIKGNERERILKSIGYREDKTPRVLLQSKQRFPDKSIVRLVWGRGVMSLTGVKTTEDQVLNFKTPGPFTAIFSCERENPEAECIPILPMRLEFSSPVSWKYAGKIILKGPNNKVYMPSKSDDNTEFVYSITFKAPFPEKATFTIEIPKDIKDDAGRNLSNIDKFPLKVMTDAYPPLAKFAARFGIIELKGDGTLPLTLRNIEPELKAKMLGIEDKKVGIVEKVKTWVLENLKGRIFKVDVGDDKEVIEWLKIVAGAKRENSIFQDKKATRNFVIPKPGGRKAFEVVGIPLKESGFYVVEIESEILGAALLGKKKPMYVSTVALVTNLSAHFKWGRENSLVWVTTLDKAQPVNNASVLITDCKGNVIWNGKTDKNGIAKIETRLPSEQNISHCEFDINYREASQALEGIGSGLFIFAKTSDDMTFVHSSWDKGIEPWRFNLPGGSYSDGEGIIAHTIFDRTLFRAGETIHMKHILRKHTIAGFEMVPDKEKPDVIVIEHQGSDQKYRIPLKWNPNGSAEAQWEIPKDVKLGFYNVILMRKEDEDDYSKQLRSGSFRVQEFRVPLMKGIVQYPPEPLIKPKDVDVDISVSYLSGGGASNLPVKLRSEVQPRYLPTFEGFDGFQFSNGRIKEGIKRSSDYETEDEDSYSVDRKNVKLKTLALTLDKAGAARAKLSGLPQIDTPKEILTELEYKDPNGEIQTVAARIPLWPSKVLVGIKPDSWALSKDSLKYQIAAVDLSRKAVSNAPVKVDLFQRKTYSHRKRLVGGFYSYEHITEIKRIGQLCKGKTEKNGILFCKNSILVSGSVILQAEILDNSGNASTANYEVWIAGKDDWWFEAGNEDRIDLLPEKKRYEPGQTARFQVRMPFREATALITIEREGIVDAFIKNISGKEPVIEIPVKGTYAPNVFVSALVVRGRVSDVQPTATVDLGKPAFRLGITDINVGWKSYELKVGVSTNKSVYKIREKIEAKVDVKTADGKLPPKGSGVAIAAVDEGLLELMSNNSWKLLEAMMGTRGYEVRTSTAQMQVIGKRHYGLKALPQGGGGGKQITRELFDTLLFWKANVALNEKGEAKVEIPLNDSLTSFRIVAVATGGVGLFGTGETSIRTTQDLMILSGIPPLVREGDKFRAGFTVRNASNRKMTVEVKGDFKDNKEKKELVMITEPLKPGEAKEIGWDINVPYSTQDLTYEVMAREKGGGEASDTLKVREKVIPAVPTRIFQATLTQIEKSFNISIQKPNDALSGKGGIDVLLRPKLSTGLDGVARYMKNYPYTCMEQKVSQAIALRDESLWKKLMLEIPSYLDSDGLVKYFPRMDFGSDVLTSYILSISSEAKYEIPTELKNRMIDGLKGFIEGRVIRYSSLPTADLSIRKMAVLEALSRNGESDPNLLGSISIEPNLWPTSAVIDWLNVLLRIKDIPDRDKKLKESEQIIRSRLNLQGTTMSFSTESTDDLWWLMVSTDENAARGLITLLTFENWKGDIPRMARGVIGRQKRGHWDTTVANAWGVRAMERFSEEFESVSVTGSTSAELGGTTETVNWKESPKGKSEMFSWPNTKEELSIVHKGSGKPWATIESLAAIPLKEPFSSGYKIKKTLIPVEQKIQGKWSAGDVVRIRLELEAQAGMTWVVVNDPIPAASSILGTGLSRDSEVLTQGEESKGWVWPAFEERSFEAFRAYYEYVPKGKWTVEYTMRLNNEGEFGLPPTRVEALYSPEMLGEMPNKEIMVEP
ncbi:MAG: alpha-2-macroglobulin family protein [Thermodesulfobacteriota bacterium]